MSARYYLLRNADGLWWRQHRAGYTPELGDAGIYTQAEADRWTGPSYDDKRISVVPIDALTEDIYAQIQRLQEMWRLANAWRNDSVGVSPDTSKQAGPSATPAAAAGTLRPGQSFADPTGTCAESGQANTTCSDLEEAVKNYLWEHGLVVTPADKSRPETTREQHYERRFQRVVDVAIRHGWDRASRPDLLEQFLDCELTERAHLRKAVDEARARVETATIIERTAHDQALKSIEEAAELRKKLEAEVERAGHYELDLAAVSAELDVPYLDARLRFPIRELKARLVASDVERKHWRASWEKATKAHIKDWANRVDPGEVMHGLDAEERP